MLLNGALDMCATLAGGQLQRLLDAPGFGCEVFVFDHFLEPARIVAVAQVIDPSGVIDPFGDLAKEDEILGAEVELSFCASKVEASFRP
ncbi:MAG: hypothetical protein ACREYE_21665 [Gammaproteobacteria bacterium]